MTHVCSKRFSWFVEGVKIQCIPCLQLRKKSVSNCYNTYLEADCWNNLTLFLQGRAACSITFISSVRWDKNTQTSKRSNTHRGPRQEQKIKQDIWWWCGLGILKWEREKAWVDFLMQFCQFRDLSSSLGGDPDPKTQLCTRRWLRFQQNNAPSMY